MATNTDWIYVRDTRTGQILPNQVPAEFLDQFDYLAETPSSRAARGISEPAGGPTVEVEVTEPDFTTANSGQTITEPAKPGKK